jgi:sugar transferase (PEP-CTERM/EpsH1 system associated)
MMIDRYPLNILYLVHRVPYPPDKGDRIRAFHLLRFLARRATVHLACLSDEPVGADVVATLRRYCGRVAVIPVGRWRWVRALSSVVRGGTVTEGAFHSPRLRATLRQWVRETHFHASLASASSMAPYLRAEELRAVPTVVDLTDVDSQKWLDYAADSRGFWAWLYRLEGRRLRRLEQALSSWACAVTLVSEAEADLFCRLCAPGPVHAIPNGVDLDHFQPRSQATEANCVFVGALDYRPNVEGVTWFCREVWPEILRRRPMVKLHLVGRRPTPAVRRLASLSGIELVGQVPDVVPHVERAAVVVVPLRIARGIQNKVLEGLAMGKAVVASPQTLVGLGVEPGTHLLAASTSGEWVNAVTRLLGDADLRRRLGAAGRRYVEEHHRWERCLEPFEPLLGLGAKTFVLGGVSAP